MDTREKLIELLKGAETKVAELLSRPLSLEEWLCVYADHLITSGVTVQEWIPANETPTYYRDKSGELIPFLVCEEGTEYPFRAMYDGKVWGDGLCEIPVTHWMPLPQPSRIDGTPEEKPQTNADRIRAMSDEELAEKLLDLYNNGTESLSDLFCDEKSECFDCNGNIICNDAKIKACIMRWLKQTTEG